MSKLIPAFILFAVLIKVIGRLSGCKFLSFFSSHHFPSFRDHTTQMMNDQAIQMANMAHQNEVNRQFHETIHHHTQEAMDFGMRSVTPIDQGGFVPPPEPPMFF